MSIFKKLLITLMILLAAAGGWYFLYWQNTPAFAAGEIQQAVQKKDWDLFCKRVDVARVYSYALNDMLAELKADGLPEHAIAASLVKSIKKEVVKELIRQTEIRFKDGAPASKSLLDKPVKTLTAYAGSSALSLTDIFKIEEKDLSRDFIWQVQLEKDVNGLWTATRILNFTDYLKERMDG